MIVSLPGLRQFGYGAVRLVKQPGYWAYALIVLVGLVNFISYADFGHAAEQRLYGDAVLYFKMSRQTFAHVPSPYAFRLLSPLIVHEMHKLGVGYYASWLLLTFAGTNLALIVFFKILYDRLKLKLFTATISTIMLGCTYNYTLYNYGNISMVDPLNNLFYAAALYFCLARRLWAFMAVVVLGSINKETMLMFAPLYPLLAWVRRGRLVNPETIRSAVAALGTMVLYLSYHVAIVWKFGAGSHAFLINHNQHTIIDVVRFALSERRYIEQFTIFKVFEFLWFIFILGLYRLFKEDGWRSEMLVLSLYLLATVVFGRLFATDTERVYVMIGPVVLAVCTTVFDAFRTEQQRLWMGLLGLVYLALNFQWVGGDTAVLLNMAALATFILSLRPNMADVQNRSITGVA